MEFRGHVGTALTAYSPVGLAATSMGATPLALGGLGVTVALASLPDVDQYVPGLAHREHTHTVWFAVGAGGVCAVAFALVGGAGTNPFRGGLAGFGFLVGAVAVLSHLAVDALTPMGVAPFAPFGERYSLGVTTSASRAANRRALEVGLVASALAFGLGGLLAPVEGWPLIASVACLTRRPGFKLASGDSRTWQPSTSSSRRPCWCSAGRSSSSRYATTPASISGPSARP